MLASLASLDLQAINYISTSHQLPGAYLRRREVSGSASPRRAGFGGPVADHSCIGLVPWFQISITMLPSDSALLCSLPYGQGLGLTTSSCQARTQPQTGCMPGLGRASGRAPCPYSAATAALICVRTGHGGEGSQRRNNQAEC